METAIFKKKTGISPKYKTDRPLQGIYKKILVMTTTVFWMKSFYFDILPHLKEGDS